MLANPVALSRYSFTYDNYGTTPATTPGGLVTAGGSANTEGSALVLATGANLAQDVYWMEISLNGTSGTGDRQMLLDIGVDPAGGTSYTWIISNIVVGNQPVIASQKLGAVFLFPFYIRAGSQVACRVQSSQASITARVVAKFFGQPSRPDAVPVGSFSETIGTITNSSGVTFTPGNAADGTYQSLGTTAKSMWWWQLGYSVSNATITGEVCFIDLAYGDGSNKHIIHRAYHYGAADETNFEGVVTNRSFMSAFCPVPAGATIYVRGRANNAPDTGYNAVAIGIGG